MTSDQQKLIINEKENTNNPSINYFFLYHKSIHWFPGADYYGTFEGSPLTTTSAYAISSQQPTILVLGGCPACKVCR